MRLPAPDKILHFAMGSLAVPAALVLQTGTGIPAHITAVPIALAMGVAREIYNKVKGGPFSPADVLATTLGAVPYAAVAAIIATAGQLSLSHEG